MEPKLSRNATPARTNLSEPIIPLMMKLAVLKTRSKIPFKSARSGLSSVVLSEMECKRTSKEMSPSMFIEAALVLSLRSSYVDLLPLIRMF